MKNKIIKTSTAKITQVDDGIILAEYFARAEETLETAIENIKGCAEFAGNNRLPVFIDYTNIRSITREARGYYAGEECSQVVSATAILTRNTISKVIANFYLGLNKPKNPTKLFTSKENAIKWLKGFLK